MEQLFILLALAFTANKIVSTIKNATYAATRGDAFTQVVVWVVAILVLYVAGEAEVTETVSVAGLAQPLGELDTWSFIVLGFIAGSTGSVAYDFKKAIDSSDSAAEPSLIHPTSHVE